MELQGYNARKRIIDFIFKQLTIALFRYNINVSDQGNPLCFIFIIAIMPTEAKHAFLIGCKFNFETETDINKKI